MNERLVIGTRSSKLALWQSNFVKSSLERQWPGLSVELKLITTKGDLSQDSSDKIPEIGGKGLFTAELEAALESREIDLAVHSLKDLPTTLADNFQIAAIPMREAANDVVVTRSGKRLAELPAGSTVGTSSVRRSAQLLCRRPDLAIEHIRGNVDTRLRKVSDPSGPYDAILLAQAGLERLQLMRDRFEILSFEDMLPAPGQGALGIEIRAEDSVVLGKLKFLHCEHSAAAVTAERGFLHALGAGCNTPVAAIAFVSSDGRIKFKGRCLSPDGLQCVEVDGDDLIANARILGARMAKVAEDRGFKKL